VTRHIRAAGPASEELEDAVGWYEERRRGLGREFFDSVGDALRHIDAHPEAGAMAFGDSDLRRLLIPRFPYQVVYRLGPNEILIIAFAHLKRRPGFWKHRR
jgi:plasmid stabilization system protein ParE